MAAFMPNQAPSSPLLSLLRLRFQLGLYCVSVEPTLHRRSSTSAKAMPAQPCPIQDDTSDHCDYSAKYFLGLAKALTQSTDDNQQRQTCSRQCQAEIGAGLCLPAGCRQPASSQVPYGASSYSWRSANLYGRDTEPTAAERAPPALLGQEAFCAALLLDVQRPDVIHRRGAQHLPGQNQSVETLFGMCM